jgi:N-acyl-phosphatidylethanolamine-hydrolysing phospholipase D
MNPLLRPSPVPASLLRRWAVTQSHIMSGRLQGAASAAAATSPPSAPADGAAAAAAADQRRGAASSSSHQPPQQQRLPSHHLPASSTPHNLRTAVASAAARLLARCGVAAATAGAVPRFTNPWPTWTGDKTFGEVLPFLKAMRERAPDGGLENIPFPTQEDYRRAFPLVEQPDLTGFPPARDQQKNTAAAAAEAPPPPADVRAVWLGHASVLARLNGLTFLTDPALSERCSPLPFAGPKRVVPPALTPQTLPHVDAVLLSHNHYDHLDASSVKQLNARFGPGGSACCPERGPLRWFVPLGLKAWFVAVLGDGVAPYVTELDWWQEAAAIGVGEGATVATTAGDGGSGNNTKQRQLESSSSPPAFSPAAQQTRVALVPAQHWSARGAFDRRASLWGGLCVLGPEARFYFAGDTGHCPAFREIGERYGPFDLAAIPTGAYEPRDFMRAQHVGPEEAVTIHQEVKAKASVAVHCCTWCLTLEPLDEPPKLLRRELAKRGLDPMEFVTLRHGAAVRVVEGKIANAPLTLPVVEAAAEGASAAAGAASSSPVALRADARAPQDQASPVVGE